MKRILLFFLSVSALVTTALWPSPGPASTKFPPGPPTEAEMTRLLATAPTIWTGSIEVHALKMWPSQGFWPLEVTDEHGMAAVRY
jgi:hypothetical protein